MLEADIVKDMFLTYFMDKDGITEIELSLDDMLKMSKEHIGGALRVDVSKDGLKYKVSIVKKTS